MGNPPKRVVLGKLIRRYFKRQGAVASEEATLLKNEMVQCWETFGVDHPKCVHLIPKLDRGWALDMIARQKYQQQVKSYPTHFQNMLTPKIDKMYYKGTDSKAHWLNNQAFKMPKY